MAWPAPEYSHCQRARLTAAAVDPMLTQTCLLQGELELELELPGRRDSQITQSFVAVALTLRHHRRIRRFGLEQARRQIVHQFAPAASRLSMTQTGRHLVSVEQPALIQTCHQLVETFLPYRTIHQMQAVGLNYLLMDYWENGIKINNSKFGRRLEVVDWHLQRVGRSNVDT